ncbi:hypothetical protein TCAL_09599 [Tigriopus californicus]|uniref:mRNA-capping enzyme n=1 Tax=Tigriopus californicus TaxID=6832 RepID=A0A553P1H1_TIGCA|nr:mRNA-capping enzyme-like [Tigriopus californicus]TRY71531.1 hypothetical protein TCAL_09599 [Tigriopus californicus]|eukprot:TCALIF_09599-PA protein Name:"Similar to Rngtt mRNA-capping enzyme (Mus musculus)" AED:0.09 eAED:0.09 QI:196/1/1/1/1/1/8/74/617
MSHRDPGPPPPRWIHCPRKSHDLIAGKFLAFKTPCDQRFDPQIEPQFRFPPSMIFDSMKGYKVKIGLWIDLCNTSRYYDKTLVENVGCSYVKLHCRGHGAAPTPDQVAAFVSLCSKFVRQNPLEIIAVHCTHGFNRSGFLIASYLVQIDDWSPEAAVENFARARPPGIYKDDYLQELFARYGDATDAPAAPPLPEWCFAEDAEDDVDDDGHAQNGGASNSNGAGGSSGSSSRRRESNKKNPTFMAGISNVHPVKQQPLLGEIQKKFQYLCKWRSNGFPGSQPVSMDRVNVRNLEEMPYKVSWKADGTRYMMLIDGLDRVFFADRDHCIFQVENMKFFHRKNRNKHLENTLVDGEMVIDQDGTKSIPRYLVYDIVTFENERVGEATFSVRALCIDKELIKSRAQYAEEGLIDKSQEPFSVRQKDFWPLHDTPKLLGPKFTKEKLGHEPDGLIFQPSKKPYTAGRDDDVLKWKPSTHNSVDFKLVVQKDSRPGMLPTTIGLLYVGGLNVPFGEMKRLKKEVRELNHKIIECTWDAERKEWVFMRERTDKSYPNSFNTAKSVVRSIQEPVTEEFLLDFIENHAYREPFHQQQHHHQQHHQQKRPPPPVPMGPPNPKRPRN